MAQMTAAQQRDAHDHRHEHTGHFGVLHEPDDAGEGGVVAGTGHLDVQHAVLSLTLPPMTSLSTAFSTGRLSPVSMALIDAARPG